MTKAEIVAQISRQSGIEKTVVSFFKPIVCIPPLNLSIQLLDFSLILFHFRSSFLC